MVSPPPYWGPIDANIDWCEPNYHYTPYVAELMNTVSSIPLILYGLYGWYMSYRYALNETRFTLSFIGLAVVGLGSTAFHATLRRYAQCLDELPMLWTAAVLFYNALDFKSGFPKFRQLKTNTASVLVPVLSNGGWLAHRRTLKLTLFFSLLWMTAIYFYFPSLFIIFFIGYGGFVISFAALMAFSLYYKEPEHFTSTPRKLYIYSFCFYFGGFTIWSLENVFCDSLPSWAYFHALWHLSAGLGTYFSVECQIAWRAEENKAKAIIHANAPIPYVQVEIVKPE